MCVTVFKRGGCKSRHAFLLDIGQELAPALIPSSPKNLKIVVDNLIVSCIVCFRISPFASKEVEVIIPTPTNAQIVCAIKKPVNVF